MRGLYFDDFDDDHVKTHKADPKDLILFFFFFIISNSYFFCWSYGGKL